MTIGWEHESKPGTEIVATLEPNGAPAPFPDIKKLLPAGWTRRDAGEPIVQWDTPIPPPEAYEHPREDVDVQGSDRLQGRRRAISARTSGRWT